MKLAIDVPRMFINLILIIRSCVAFNGASRFLGAAAEQQMVTNVANTINSFSRLIGKMESDPAVAFEREHTFFQIVADSQGRAAIKVCVNFR